jgi:hypothetical protein
MSLFVVYHSLHRDVRKVKRYEGGGQIVEDGFSSVRERRFVSPKHSPHRELRRTVTLRG